MSIAIRYFVTTRRLTAMPCVKSASRNASSENGALGSSAWTILRIYRLTEQEETAASVLMAAVKKSRSGTILP